MKLEVNGWHFVLVDLSTDTRHKAHDREGWVECGCKYWCELKLRFGAGSAGLS